MQGTMFSLFRIALRNVIRNRRRSLLTLAAVFLAVAIMVTVHGVLNGLHASIRDQVVNGQTGAIQIHRKGYLKSVQGAALELDVPADDVFLSKVAKIDGITAVAPRIFFGGMANAHDQTVVALFFAFDPVRELRVCPTRAKIVTSGRMIAPGMPNGADLSTELMRRIAAKKGEKVALLSNDVDGSLGAVEVDVAGEIGDGGMPMPDKKIAVLPLGVAQELLRMPGRATEIAISVRDLDQIGAIIPKVRAAVGPEYEVSSWRQVAGFVDQLIEIENFALNVVAATFLGIAMLGIANTMLMNVLERTREIGTMMAVGLRRRGILTLFLAEAGLLGLTGATAGAACGLAIVAHFGRVGMHFHTAGNTKELPMYPFAQAPFVLFVFALAVVGAVLAALYPAWRASRLRPIQALGQA